VCQHTDITEIMCTKHDNCTSASCKTDPTKPTPQCTYSPILACSAGAIAGGVIGKENELLLNVCVLFCFPQLSKLFLCVVQLQSLWQQLLSLCWPSFSLERGTNTIKQRVRYQMQALRKMHYLRTLARLVICLTVRCNKISEN
jgi:hypothetical protein